MKYSTITKILLMLTILLNIFGINALTIIYAAEPPPDSLLQVIGNEGLNTVGADAYGYTNPKAPKDIPRIISDAILIALSMAGSIFLALIFYAGFRWLTSAGNDEVIKKNKGILIHAVIGLVIILSSYAIAMFIIQAALFSTLAENNETFQYEN